MKEGIRQFEVLEQVMPGETLHRKWNNAGSLVYALSASPKEGQAGSAEITHVEYRVIAHTLERELHYWVKNTSSEPIDIEIWASWWTLPFYDTIRRQSHKLGASISHVSSVAMGHRVATATRTSSGTLQVTVWDVGESGDITPVGSADAGAVSEVALTSLGDDRVVTAVRTASGTLKLIQWRMGGNQVTRLESAEAGEADQFSICPLDSETAVTACRQSDGRLKLISWQCSENGEITRQFSVAGESVETVSSCRVPLGSHRVVVTATRSSNRLNLATWQVGGGGQLTQLSSAETEDLDHVSMSPISYGCVGIAGQDAQGKLRVATWDVDELGVLNAHSQAMAGHVDAISTTSLSAARFITAVKQSDGNLKLISWDAIDELKRMGSATAGEIGYVTVCSIGNDRIVTAVRDSDGALKMIVWNEHSVPLLRSSWGPVSPSPTSTSSLPVPSSAAPGQSPAPLLSFAPGFGRVEPRLAVGLTRIIVVEGGGRIGIFDKLGNRLLTLTTTNFFRGFIAPYNADGSINRNNINRHLGMRLDISLPQQVDPNLGTGPVINVFYDTRVYFCASSNRWFIVTAARHPLWYDDGPAMTAEDYLVRRYYAFAVSKTEDPLDGFHQYMSTETSYADWPRFTVNNSLLMITHYWKTSPKDGFKPSLRFFDVNALQHGHTHPPSFKVYPPMLNHNRVIPVNHFGHSEGWTYLVKRENKGKVIDIYFTKTPINLADFSDLQKTSISLQEDAPTNLRTPAVFRNGKLHLVCVKKISDPIANQQPPRYSIRVIRIPIEIGPNGLPHASTDPDKGFIDTFFGRSALEDAEGDLVSYEIPAIAVNKHGHMLIVYGRVGVQTAVDLFQETRYSVIYDDARGLQRSNILKAGEFLATSFHNYGGTTETTATATTFFDFLQSVNADVDPTDDEGIWMIHTYTQTSAGDFQVVVGQVQP